MKVVVRKLDSWHFWVGVAYFGLAAVVIALWILFGRTAAERATRSAAQKAAAITQVQTCFTAVKNAPVARGFVKGQEALIDNGILSNTALQQVSAYNDPLRPIRDRSLDRLAKAKKNLMALRNLISKTTPTRPSCVKLSKTLRVDYKRFLNPKSRKTG